MMNDWQLDDDLQSLENELARRPPRRPSTELRQRVLAEAQAQLGVKRSAKRRQFDWQFAAAAAVVMLVWMNLSMSGTQATDFGFRRGAALEPVESVETIAQRIEQLAPDMPPREVRRQALLMQAGVNMSYMPDLGRSRKE